MRRSAAPASINIPAADSISHIDWLVPVSGSDSAFDAFVTGTATGSATAAAGLPPVAFVAETLKPYFWPARRPAMVHDVAGAVTEHDRVDEALTDAAATPLVRGPTGVAVAV